MNIKEVWQEITSTINIKKTASKAGREVKYLAVDLGVLFVKLWIYAGTAAIFGSVAFKIIAVGGIEAVLAELMAATCVNNSTIPCDFQSLLAGAGLALVICTGLAIAVMREVVKMEVVPFEDQYEPSRGYNDTMAEVLRDIQGLGGLESLHAFGNFKGIHYTTLRRYIDRYERDGYVTIHSSGKGAALEVRLAK